MQMQMQQQMRGFFAPLRMTGCLGGVEGKQTTAMTTANATANAGVLRSAQNDRGFGWVCGKTNNRNDNGNGNGKCNGNNNGNNNGKCGGSSLRSE
jgi:hypothetical protein